MKDKYITLKNNFVKKSMKKGLKEIKKMPKSTLPYPEPKELSLYELSLEVSRRERLIIQDLKPSNILKRNIFFFKSLKQIIEDFKFIVKANNQRFIKLEKRIEVLEEENIELKNRG